MVIPIYRWGVSATYVGTHPSGYWQYDESSVEQILTILPPDLDANNFAIQLFEREQRERIASDKALQELTTQIQQSVGGRIRAAAVELEDPNGYFDGNNVELALAELAVGLINQGRAIEEVYRLLTGIQPGQGSTVTTDDLGIIIEYPLS